MRCFFNNSNYYIYIFFFFGGVCPVAMTQCIGRGRESGKWMRNSTRRMPFNLFRVFCLFFRFRLIRASWKGEDEGVEVEYYLSFINCT